MKTNNILVSKENIHIEDSYQISKKSDMREMLEVTKDIANSRNIDCSVFEKRSINSMVAEWRSHNLLYDLHLFRTHTKDVDINLISKFADACYRVVSLFYFYH